MTSVFVCNMCIPTFNSVLILSYVYFYYHNYMCIIMITYSHNSLSLYPLIAYVYSFRKLWESKPSILKSVCRRRRFMENNGPRHAITGDVASTPLPVVVSISFKLFSFFFLLLRNSACLMYNRHRRRFQFMNA